MTRKEDKIVVRLTGGGPWGFRLQGGAGTGLPLTVSKIRRKSKAYKNLFEGDVILTVNGKSCDDLTYDQVMEIADKSGSQLNLEVMRQSSNKENVAPDVSTVPPNLLEKNVAINQDGKSSQTKEIVTVTETQRKVTEEMDDLRINSATLCSEDTLVGQQSTTQSIAETERKFEKASTTKAGETFSATADSQNDEREINFDTSIKTATQEIITDENEFQKLATETVHEKAGNKEATIYKKEFEKMTKEQNKIPPSSLDKSFIDSIPSCAGLEELLKSVTSEIDSFKTEKTELIKIEKTEKNVKTDFTDVFDTANEISSNIDLKDVNFSTTDRKDTTFTTTTSSSLKKEQVLNSDTCYLSSDSSLEQITRKKKMFSSSSFYEEPHSIYPTVEEQVEMAKKIADSLADDTNKKSKGANMFFKRVKRSTKWIHEGPEPSDDSAPGTPELQQEPPTPDPSQVPWKTKQGLPKLKLVLDPRHTLDAVSLRSTGQNINEHNVISPEVCHDLVRDLESPVGKGAALFAKRKKKSEEWIVDEEKVKMRAQENKSSQLQESLNASRGYGRTTSVIEAQRIKLLKTPWDAALESPIGSCDAAFMRVDPGYLAETVMKAADNKRQESFTTNMETSMETCQSPTFPITPAAVYYDIYKPKAPKGWIGTSTNQSNSIYNSTTSTGLTRMSFNETIATNNQSFFTYTSPKKMTFQNFNTIPRKWKATN